MPKRRKKKPARIIQPSAGPLPNRLSGQFTGKLLVFSDASRRKNGGLAAVLYPDSDAGPWIATRSVAPTGSNELELQAALFALQEARQNFPERQIALFSDNRDCVLRLQEALAQDPAEDAELAAMLAERAISLPMAGLLVTWVKSHATCRGNLLADRYAAAAAESGLGQPMFQAPPELDREDSRPTPY